MEYEKKTCKILSALIDVVPGDKRENVLISAINLSEKIKGTAKRSTVENFLSIFDMEFVVFGSWGECGLAVFMDRDFREVLRIAFEQDSKGTHSWFVENKEEE